jgi:nucleotide-binding universal stress UspA family protein
MAAADEPGPVLFAYDGSELARLAIREAGTQLEAGRDAVVATVWETFNVGFLAPSDADLDASNAEDVRQAAEKTAAEGAGRAEAAGFRPQGIAVQMSPTWQGLVQAADQRGARLIAIGSHSRTGISRVLLGSVAAAIASHWHGSVLIVH